MRKVVLGRNPPERKRKCFGVVVKGIDSSVPLADIKDALELEGYEVKSVFNILNKNKVPQPMFKIEIAINYSQMKKKGEVHPIYNLKYLLNRRVVVEEPIKRKGPPQCQNCQEFGHTKTLQIAISLRKMRRYPQKLGLPPCQRRCSSFKMQQLRRQPHSKLSWL
ncbi:Nucleic-acid-binding protein from mobile element jockey [Eumeta japonica]|uniref:Nucleic-acid-binding protein from mobile element jockey n=1 Tax=Eumeta variegata TaxID=151549 RepID=A0A4C1SF64_EUMVA|nr:Nucleic-acid-binding protein from mobile element jockey [Eumeta japonica]